MTPNADVAGVEGAVTLLTIELEDNTAWELLIELAESGGHPNIALRASTRPRSRRMTTC